MTLCPDFGGNNIHRPGEGVRQKGYAFQVTVLDIVISRALSLSIYIYIYRERIMIVIRIIMIIIRIMIIIMYCITYDMASIMSCSALFDYVLLYVILFDSGILRYGFHFLLYPRILYYSILYLCSVLRIIFYLFEVISRPPKWTSLLIIDNIIQS